MTNDCIGQSWYRFLNTIGNPVALTKPEVISQTPTFLHFAISSGVVDPCHHASLQVLPLIFLKAMKGIAGQVDAFLGMKLIIFIERVWYLHLHCGGQCIPRHSEGVKRQLPFFYERYRRIDVGSRG